MMPSGIITIKQVLFFWTHLQQSWSLKLFETKNRQKKIQPYELKKKGILPAVLGNYFIYL